MKWPELWKAHSYRNSDGTLEFDRVSEEKKMTQTSGSDGVRNEFFEWELHYERGFNKHHTGAVLKYTQSSKVSNQNIGTDLKMRLPVVIKDLLDVLIIIGTIVILLTSILDTLVQRTFIKIIALAFSQLFPVHGI